MLATILLSSSNVVYTIKIKAKKLFTIKIENADKARHNYSFAQHELNYSLSHADIFN